VRPRQTCGSFHLVGTHIAAQRDGAAHGGVEQERVLRDVRQLPRQLAGGEPADVAGVEVDGPAVGVPEACQQQRQRGLARPGGISRRWYIISPGWSAR
jgi:hypothetical protein